MENMLLEKYNLLHFNELVSTQTYAHELVVSNTAMDKTVIIADIQTGGYGRYNRKWISEPGNLYLSFIYKTNIRDPRLSYAVAVAVAETLMYFGINPNIKWPNDVLIDGKKVCGILIEYHKDFVIIGIGINVSSSPKISQYETAKVSDYADISCNDILSKLINKLDFWRLQDFSIVRSRWTDMAIGLNTVINYNGTAATLMGINEDGALVLRIGSKYVMKYGDEISI